MEQQLDSRVGRILQNRYRVMDPIASGAMGIVYRAERLQLGRSVAIKFLHAQLASQPQLRRRFEIEAKAMSRLSHPNCVSIIDFGVDDAPYLVMDLVTGKTLSEIIASGAISATRAIAIVRQILAALAHAHKHGIIHRDLKPANVIVNEDLTGTGDHVRILDFGLAKLRDAGISADASRSNFALGTPSYMPPEQVRGESVDARSDIYSVGIILFELLTGQKPFKADDPIDILRLQRDAPPPYLRQSGPGQSHSAQMEALLLKTMAKGKEQRYQSAGELLHALDCTPEASGKSHAAVAYAKTIRPDAPHPPPAQATAHPPPATATESSATTSALPRSGLNASRDRPHIPRNGPRLLWTLFALCAVGVGAYWGAVKHQQALKAQDKGAHEAATKVDHQRRTRKRPPNPVSAAVEIPEETPSKGSTAATDVGSQRRPFDAGKEDAGKERDAATDADGGRPCGATTTATTDGRSGCVLDSGNPRLARPARRPSGVGTKSVRPSRQRPVVVESIPQTVARLLRSKNITRAIRGLRKLQAKHPNHAFLPFVLGNLYMQRAFMYDAVVAYERAIKLNSHYRSHSGLTRNVISALASQRAHSRATRLILRRIGRAAIPYLRTAARKHPNRTVRKRASALLRRLR